MFFIGDFNARHRYWNCQKMNKAGEILFREYETSDFFIHFPAGFTRMAPNGRSTSTLDLVLLGNSMDMSVPETIQYLSSDHFPVMFTINADTPFKNEFRQYRNYKRANWTVYVISVSRRLDLTSYVINNLDTEDKIDTAIETLVTTLVEAERVSVPVVNCNPQKRDLPDRIKLLIRLRNVRRRQYCRTRDPLLRTIVENLNL